jgi:hypothetical protein
VSPLAAVDLLFGNVACSVNLAVENAMDKKIAGLLGAVGVLASLNGAQASSPADPAAALKAQTYADLLNPISNAAATLAALDEASERTGASFQVAANSHHHHHHSYRHPHRHHHHHHHHR